MISKSQTEDTYPHSKPIDKLVLNEAIDLMISEQKKSISSLENNVQNLEKVINSILKRIKESNHGRLIYSGAGTSGRIAVQDGIELYPTFGWSKKRLSYVLSGGQKALYTTVENAEDNEIVAKRVSGKIKFTSKDILIAISASGNTPFTLKVLQIAKSKNALTVVICNNPMAEMIKHSDHSIILETKEELVAGSTRLKAGTAQKACVNLISTLVMCGLGNVKNGQMINMVPTNKKLILRKRKIDKITEN